MKRKNIPIFFAIDDNYIKLLKVALASLVDHSSEENIYRICILHTGLSQASKNALKVFKRKNVKIKFINVAIQMEVFGNKLNVRDYYTLTTYYRLILPETFINVKKALYLDSDIVLLDDVAKLYNVDIGDNLVGAVKDSSVQLFPEFITYVEKALQIPHEQYFNAGILVMNFKKMRQVKFEKQIVNLVKKVSFKVAQDQDLLNVVCKDKVTYIPVEWNTMPLGDRVAAPSLIHFNLTLKPWKRNDVLYEEVFWDYAGKAGVKEELFGIKSLITPEMTAQQEQGLENLKKLCLSEARRRQYYSGIKKAQEEPVTEREEILQKIALFEKEGKFDQDVENDPPSRLLKPGDVDYLKKKFFSKFKAKFTTDFSFRYFNKLIKKGVIVIDGYEGVDNLRRLKKGAVITSNHFNPFDSIPIHKICKKVCKKRKLFKVIREGNYSFPGLFGKFMRNCYTLPLSNNYDVMREMMNATNTILRRGDLVLVYAEQSMWWNYRKPKPLKIGAFKFAAKANVPVVPTFITMRDTDKLDENGYPIQAYTLHILKPIYPNPSLNILENAENMKKENERVWKEVYEKVYGIPLTYTTEK
jgi:lipopolysaccharide biosynthesis glycosyltransferase